MGNGGFRALGKLRMRAACVGVRHGDGLRDDGGGHRGAPGCPARRHGGEDAECGHGRERRPPPPTPTATPKLHSSFDCSGAVVSATCENDQSQVCVPLTRAAGRRGRRLTRRPGRGVSRRASTRSGAAGGRSRAPAGADGGMPPSMLAGPCAAGLPRLPSAPGPGNAEAAEPWMPPGRGVKSVFSAVGTDAMSRESVVWAAGRCRWSAAGPGTTSGSFGIGNACGATGIDVQSFIGPGFGVVAIAAGADGVSRARR